MVAFVSPFQNDENAYIELQKALLRDLGFDVRPLSISAVLRGRCFGLFQRRNVVLVHWLENRLFEVGAVDRGLSLSGACGFVAQATLLALARARVVYFVHDHAVHDVRPELSDASRWAIGLLRRLADVRVVHDPSFTAQYGAHYLPHPLYWNIEQDDDDASMESAVPNAPGSAEAAARPGGPSFLILGAIRPYKGLRGVLQHWPHGVPLQVVGKGAPDFVQELQDIIEARGLAPHVSIDARFLSDEEFSRTIRSHDVIVLPHIRNANLVSGAFFASIGRARVILARQTPFIDWARARFPGVYAFDGDDDLAATVQEIVTAWPGLRTLDSTKVALSHFGPDACRRAYQSVLRGHRNPSGGGSPVEPSRTDVDAPEPSPDAPKPPTLHAARSLGGYL